MNEHPPRPKNTEDAFGAAARDQQTEALDTDLFDYDGIAKEWFEGTIPLVETPAHTPATEGVQPPQNVIESVLHFIRNNPRGSLLLTGVSMAIAACSVDFEKYVEQKDVTEQEEPQTESITSVEIEYDVGQIDLTINGKISIHVRDGLNPDAAPEQLEPIALTNPLFEWHADIVMAQYQTSFGAPNPIHAFQDPASDWRKKNTLVTEDSFVDYGTAYGNMEIDDIDFVSRYMEAMWLDGARILYGDQFETVEDLESLSAQQWMAVLQAPGLSIEYDESLASIYPSYDAKKTDEHKNNSIDELIQGGVGVCRDTERLNITSYMIANERFNLLERGLLYVPQMNIADAKHTRGAFMWSQSPTDIVVIGVDTTFASGDIHNTFDVTQADTVAWYAQQFDDSIITDSKTHIGLYELALQMLPEMSPTAIAMLERSIVFEKIALYEEAESTTEKRSALNDAFETLLSQIVKEETVEVFPLNVPSRKVRLYDIFLRIARELDALNGNAKGGIHTATAKKYMEKYLSQGGIDAEAARYQVEEIDRLSSDERDTYLKRLTAILES